MAIPTLSAARELLLDFGLPDGVITHSEGVRAVAAAAAKIIAESGIPVDPSLVEVAALLHDIDKLQTRASGGRHGEVGAKHLERLGYAELGPPVRSHPVRCLLDEERFPRGWASVLVSIADRHVAQHFLTIDERLADMIERYPAHSAAIEQARRPAHRLERDAAEAAGVPVDELVEALRDAWARDVVVADARERSARTSGEGANLGQS